MLQNRPVFGAGKKIPDFGGLGACPA